MHIACRILQYVRLPGLWKHSKLYCEDVAQLESTANRPLSTLLHVSPVEFKVLLGLHTEALRLLSDQGTIEMLKCIVA
jgi:hypothetical protein